MDFGLKDRVALVAAASRGIGFACARELAREGVRVFLCSRDGQHASDAAQKIHQETGADVAGNTSTSGLTFTSDVTRPSVTAPSVNAAYYTSLSVPVTMNTGSASDGGIVLAASFAAFSLNTSDT